MAVATQVADCYSHLAADEQPFPSRESNRQAALGVAAKAGSKVGSDVRSLAGRLYVNAAVELLWEGRFDDALAAAGKGAATPLGDDADDAVSQSNLAVMRSAGK